MEVEEPEDLSSQRLSWIMDQVERPEETAVSADHPNIIAIMNESWADFEEFGTLSLSESVTDYIRSLDNAIWGHAYTSVFGAGTSASEFEFLTGNSMAFLPSGSIPYQQYILDDSPSLASLLRRRGTAPWPSTRGSAPPGSATRPTPCWALTALSAVRTWTCPRLWSTAT